MDWVGGKGWKKRKRCSRIGWGIVEAGSTVAGVGTGVAIVRRLGIERSCWSLMERTVAGSIAAAAAFFLDPTCPGCATRRDRREERGYGDIKTLMAVLSECDSSGQDRAGARGDEVCGVGRKVADVLT